MQAVNQLPRTAATDDEVNDHIGTDTPGSGIATPQPDPQDKRLPGIMSYFGQVRQDPSTSLTSSSTACPQLERTAKPTDDHKSSVDSRRQQPTQESVQSSLPSSIVRAASQPSLAPAVLSTQPAYVQPSQNTAIPYPTPPSSQPCSSASSAIQASSFSCSKASKAAQADASSSSKTLEKAISVAQSSELQVPSLSGAAPAQPTSAPTQQDTPPPPLSSTSHPNDSPNEPCDTSSSKWFSLDTLKELTRGVIFKSGPSTPTRALSSATPSQSEGKATPSRTSNEGAERSGTQTPRTNGGAQAPAAKGKLNIKIAEARGLRRCRDPYVVAVFQRSELISGGPRPSDDDEAMSSTPAAIGSIPIQRQASDSGRPPMAIPMRSRQSSNTSVTDYNTFRNRSNVNRAFYTNPHWDAEAVL